MCCKLPLISVLGKPPGQWCEHCTIGVGCTIYDDRPQMCRDFFCQWIENKSIADYWKPEASKIILTQFPRTGFLYAQVDPARPDAWKAPKLLSDLQRWAKQLLPVRKHVVVFVNDDATLIMPDQSVPLGRMRLGEGFAIRTTYRNGKPVYEVRRG
ncbi:hypothetical protein ABMA32_08315 [Mesorhizobium sp. VNQ89]|uniref:hypothetical protein n=1 Tax=Mesorhizobium quangtriensis TaxID=3157709 RepID=UPI0032B7F676